MNPANHSSTQSAKASPQSDEKHVDKIGGCEKTKNTDTHGSNFKMTSPLNGNVNEDRAKMSMKTKSTKHAQRTVVAHTTWKQVCKQSIRDQKCEANTKSEHKVISDKGTKISTQLADIAPDFKARRGEFVDKLYEFMYFLKIFVKW